jgi:hypothetical protein
MTDTCKCGAAVDRVEVRMIRRCTNGHIAGMTMAAPPIDPDALHEPITDGQIRALNGKAGALDKLRQAKPGSSKKEALAAAGVASTKDLDARSASELLDRLEAALDARR